MTCFLTMRPRAFTAVELSRATFYFALVGKSLADVAAGRPTLKALLQYDISFSLARYTRSAARIRREGGRPPRGS